MFGQLMDLIFCPVHGLMSMAPWLSPMAGSVLNFVKVKWRCK